MGIKLSDVVAPYSLASWGTNPGIPIKNQYKGMGKPVENAEKAYQKFIKEKIPSVKVLIGRLVQHRQINTAHLPLTLRLIFLNFLDELIEHYQNQLEERDEEIDQQLLKIKRLILGKGIAWENNSPELQNLFNNLRRKLTIEDALPPNFDNVMSIWREILSIQNMGNMCLAALYEKSAECYQIHNEELFIKGCYLSHESLMQSYQLLLRQIHNNSIWVFSEMQEKIPRLDDQALEITLRQKIADPNHPEQLQQPVSAFVQQYISKMEKFLKQLSLLDVNELKPDEVMTLARQNAEIKETVCTQVYSNNLDDKDIEQMFLYHLNNFTFASEIKSHYLTGPIDHLMSILLSLSETNRIWDDYQNKKKDSPPLLTSQITPLLPQVLEYDSSAKSENVSFGQIPKEKKESQKNQPKAPVPPEKKPNPPEKPKARSKNTPTPAAPMVILNPNELLRNKLIDLHQANPSRALRQAIWHLDSLICIQKSLGNSQKKAPECLTLANAATLCAQKVLEQTYRFSTKEEKAPPAKIHNLKTYHRAYDSAFTSYPLIVKDLFLANNWCRYFYHDHKNWYSLTSRMTKIPPILDSLVAMAEGKGLSPKQLKALVNGTIENVRQHVDHLLGQQKIPQAQTPVAPNEAMALKTPLSLQTFDIVSQQLNDILIASKLNADHPVHLRMKQVMAALKMQKSSLQKINSSKDLHSFSTWTVWSLQQLQESVEGILHCIEYFKNQRMSKDHEIKTLAEKIEVDIGPLGNAFQNLSYKVRYPAEVLVDGAAAQVIDDLEALKQHPEIMQGFKVQMSSMIWAFPSEGASPDAIAAKLNKLLSESEEFLRLKALPVLKTKLKPPTTTS